MSDNRDPNLQTLFTRTSSELDGEAFTASVMAQTHSHKYRLLAVGIAAALLIAACMWFFTLPMLEFVQLVTQVLTTTLVDLGDGWLGWILTPVNNIASLSVLSVKAIRVAWKKIVSASYAY